MAINDKESAQTPTGRGHRVSPMVSDYFHERASRTEFAGRDTADVFRKLCDEWPAYYRSATRTDWNGDPPLPASSWAYRRSGIHHLVRHTGKLDRPYSLMEAVAQSAVPITTAEVRLVEDLAAYVRLMQGSRLHIREAKWATACAGLLPTAPPRHSYLYSGWMRGLATIVKRYAATDRYLEGEYRTARDGEVSDVDKQADPGNGGRPKQERPFVDSSHWDLFESSAAIPLSLEQPWVSESEMTPEVLKAFVFKNTGDRFIADYVAARFREEGLTGADPLGAAARGPDPGGGPPTFEEQVLYFLGQMHGQKPLPLSNDYEEVSYLDPRVQRVVLSLRSRVGAGPARDQSKAPVLTGKLVLDAFAGQTPSEPNVEEDDDA